MTTTLFDHDHDRLTLAESIRLTTEWLNAYAERYRHWVIAFSGGKDGSAALTVALDLVESGEVPKPASLTVLNADARMEMPPLQICAEAVMQDVRTKVVRQDGLPVFDDRFWIYTLGRGVPPRSLLDLHAGPRSATAQESIPLCTPQLKIEPMLDALKDARDQAKRC